mmetsp:Transcript_18719/g.57683  ORF Transcript_18719/g.57683 Transcript_18719/m.57683 type:complete len:229 (+) Transcript_18719:310-996(+)
MIILDPDQVAVLRHVAHRVRERLVRALVGGPELRLALDVALVDVAARRGGRLRARDGVFRGGRARVEEGPEDALAEALVEEPFSLRVQEDGRVAALLEQPFSNLALLARRRRRRDGAPDPVDVAARRRDLAEVRERLVHRVGHAPPLRRAHGRVARQAPRDEDHSRTLGPVRGARVLLLLVAQVLEAAVESRDALEDLFFRLFFHLLRHAAAARRAGAGRAGAGACAR